MTVMELLKAPGVGFALFLYGHVMLLGIAYTAGTPILLPFSSHLLTAPVTPVFWYTRPSLGGYGFSPVQISAFIASIGISQAIWLLVIFPPLQARYTTRGVLKGCLTAWPVFFAAAPLCNWFLRMAEASEDRKAWRIAFWVVAPVLQIGGSGVAMAFSKSFDFYLL